LINISLALFEATGKCFDPVCSAQIVMALIPSSAVEIKTFEDIQNKSINFSLKDDKFSLRDQIFPINERIFVIHKRGAQSTKYFMLLRNYGLVCFQHRKNYAIFVSLVSVLTQTHSASLRRNFIVIQKPQPNTPPFEHHQEPFWDELL
jgi:hypothetical protein